MMETKIYDVNLISSLDYVNHLSRNNGSTLGLSEDTLTKVFSPKEITLQIKEIKEREDVVLEFELIDKGLDARTYNFLWMIKNLLQFSSIA